MKAFHGTWRLVSGRACDATGRPTLVVSDGVLHYTSTGLVAAQCVVSSDSPDPAVRAALGGYVAYFGTYTVDEATRTVAHRIRGSNVPGYVGKVLPREYAFSGDRLTLLARLADQVEIDPGMRAEIVWERVGDR